MSWTYTLHFSDARFYGVRTGGGSQTVLFAEDDQSDYVGISIDGSYDDWNDKPHTKIQYPWDDANYYHQGALFRDEQYVYLHVRMSERSYTQFNGYNYCFTADGKETYVAVVPPEGEQIGEGNNTVVVRAQNGYSLIDGAEGVVTRKQGEPDEWELRIPLSFLSDQPELIKEITFHSSNLGPQNIIATGTPTLPFLVAGTGAAIAVGGFLHSKRKKDK